MSMSKKYLLLALWTLVSGGQAWAQAYFGDMPSMDLSKARITDIGIAVSQVERTITTDSITGQRDTTYQVLPQELVWQSEGLNINDSVAVVNAVKGRRTRKSPTRGPKEQSGVLMEYFQGFSYYVFSFNYPSIDAEGNELTLSAMAACPLKSGTSEVRNVILGTHITITADRERPTSHFNGFDQDDWGMMFSMAAGPKFILTGDLQAALVAANLASYFIINLYLPGVGFLLSGLITAYQIGQIAKAAGNYEYNYNLVIMPDYEGYGASKDRAHPYQYQELTARQCLDATRYGIELYKTDASLKYISMPLRSEYRTISCGYSQGGSVAMACHRFAEQNNLVSELHYAGSICGDGPYDPVATLMYYVSQEKEEKPMSMPVVLPLIVKGMLDTNPYMQSHRAEDYFNPKFLETGIMDWLGSKEKSTTDIDHEFERLYNEGKDGNKEYFRDVIIKYKDGNDEKIGARLSALMNADCYAYFSKLYEDYKDSFTSASGIPLPTHRGVMEDLHFALASNDMTSGWEPKHTIKLFHSKGDRVVPYVNAERAKNALGGKVDLTTAPNGQDHGESGVDFFKGDDTVDVGWSRFLNLRLYDWVEEMCSKDY